MAISTDTLTTSGGIPLIKVSTDFRPHVYGQPIPRTQGHRIVSGLPIWASPLRYVTKTVPYFGDPDVTTQYDFPYRDFAISFGENILPTHSDPVVLRMWMDGVLVYDATDPTVTYPDLNWTLYPGSETQTADAAIVADQGTLAPAFRGLIYAVFKNFPLKQKAESGTSVNVSPFVAFSFTYSVPMIKVELVDGLVIDNTKVPFTMLSGSTILNHGLMADWDQANGLLYGFSGYTGSSAALHTFDAGAQAELTTVNITGAYTNLEGIDDLALLDSKNGKVLAQGDGVANTGALYVIDLNTGAILNKFGTSGAGTTETATSMLWADAGDLDYILKDGVEQPVAVYNSLAFKDVVFITYDKTTGVVANISLTERYADAVNNVALYPILSFGGGGVGGFQDGCAIVCTGQFVKAIYFGFRAGVLAKLGEITILDCGSGRLSEYIVIDPHDKNVIIFDSAASGTGWRATKLQCQPTNLEQPDLAGIVSDWHGKFPFFNGSFSGAPLYQVTVPDMPIDDVSLRTAFLNSNLSSGTLAYEAGGQLNTFQLGSGKVVSQSFPLTLADYVWDSRIHTVFYPATSNMNQSGINATSGENKTIGDYLLGLAEIAGYAAGDISVDAALTDPVVGVVLDKAYDTQKLFGDLGLVYDFSYFESDSKVKFVRSPRGDGTVTPVYDLSIVDLAIEGGLTGADALLTTISQPAAQTGSLSLDYIDIAKNGDHATQTYSLDKKTSDAVGTAVQAMAIPIVMSATEAYTRVTNATVRQAADKSVVQEMLLPPKCMLIEPSDVIAITMAPFRYFIQMDEVTFNADFSISGAGFNHSTQANVPVPASTNLGFVGGDENFGIGDSKPVVFDMPLLSPSYDTGAAAVVLQTGLQSFGQTVFSGANLQFGPSPTGPYNIVYTTRTALVNGVTVGTLADTAYPFQTDNTTVLTVALRSGTADSFLGTDATGLLNGVNAVIIGAPGRWELIYFRDVTVVNPKIVQLSGLLRGRRGTDHATGSHVASDAVYLVYSCATGFTSGIAPQSMNADHIGDTLRYMASCDPTLRGPQTLDVTVTGESARCWKPAKLAATASGSDIVLTWVRRDRLGTEFVTNPQPLSETSEKYDLEILSGTTVVRTVANLSSPTYTYVAADQTTDGFTPPLSSISIRVYQLSALTGRGYPAGEVLNVN